MHNIDAVFDILDLYSNAASSNMKGRSSNSLDHRVGDIPQCNRNPIHTVQFLTLLSSLLPNIDPTHLNLILLATTMVKTPV
jgi:hypothetical protein